MSKPRRGELVRNNGRWTQAKFNSFIKNNLRSASRKWAPINECKKRANVGRGVYKCAECKEEVAPTTVCPETRKRIKNVFVDHIVPIVDPEVGFVSWDSVIERMFCDSDNLQLLCKGCHDIKSLEDIEKAKLRRANSKLNIEDLHEDTFQV